MTPALPGGTSRQDLSPPPTEEPAVPRTDEDVDRTDLATVVRRGSGDADGLRRVVSRPTVERR